MRTIKIMVASILSVLAPIESVIIATLVLVITDFVLGILAAVKRKEPITSAGIRRTLTKIFIFEVALIMAFITEQYFTGASVPVQKVITCFIGLTELTSIAENLNEISGNSLLSALIDKLGSNNLK